jgi:hypothetical protein
MTTRHRITSQVRSTMWHRAHRTGGTTGWARQAGTMWGRTR